MANQDATVYVGGLDEKVSEPLLWELFLQAGPVVNTTCQRIESGQHQGYDFDDADYAIKIMNMIKLYGKPIQVNKTSVHHKNMGLLYDTFSTFGVILQIPKIKWDPDTGNSKVYAFINFTSFDASDAAIEAMNGQYLCNCPITISYAFKKDSKGECHGLAAGRLLAAQNPLSQPDRPHQLFADAPPPPSAPNPMVSSLGSGLPPPGMSPPGSFPLPVPPPTWDTPHHAPPPMPPGAAGHGPPSAGTPEAGHPDYGHSQAHPFPPGGVPYPGMSQMQLTHHGPHGLGHPHSGPPESPFGSPMGHPGPMPSHGVRGPPPLMPPPHVYTGPPRPTPYGYQPLPPPRPTPQPPVAP
uniref:RRM domain-containing protein n=1 Tax=Rhinopithecus roxellana TaxID=61622 RepID=A0A2K6NUF4_RHIRO